MDLLSFAIVAIIVAWLLVHGVDECGRVMSAHNVIRAIIYFGAVLFIVFKSGLIG